MLKTRLTGLLAGTALVMLAACGQGESAPGAGDDAPAVEASSAIADAPVANRAWMPAAIALPEPHSVLQDMKVGANTHLLQIVVPDDPAAEFPRWKEALVAGGYDVNDSMLFDGRLLFQGQGVESGQIAVSAVEEGGYMIQVDVSLLP